jgi:hypothetical protein
LSHYFSALCCPLCNQIPLQTIELPNHRTIEQKKAIGIQTGNDNFT